MCIALWLPDVHLNILGGPKPCVCPPDSKTPHCGTLWTQSDSEVTKSWRKNHLKVTKCKGASGSGDPRNQSPDRI